MTTEEKRVAIRAHCNGTSCKKCKLDAVNSSHCTCYSGARTDAEIDLNYAILFGEDKPEQTTQTEQTTRKSILQAAIERVTKAALDQYGKPESNFLTIANLWIDYLSAKQDPLDITAHDVAAMLALLKIARIASGHEKADNWIDLAGYAACGGEIQANKEGAI